MVPSAGCSVSACPLKLAPFAFGVAPIAVKVTSPVFVPELFEPLIAPEQARFPVAPSIVQPVAPEPPAILIDAPVPAPGPIFNAVVAAPPIFNVVAPVLKRFPVVDVVLTVPPLIEALLAVVIRPAVFTDHVPSPVNANVPVLLPIATFPVPAVAIFTSLAPVVAMLVVPVEVSVVNLPVEAVVAPIAVVFIPVEVVFKFPEVIVILFAPAFIEDAPRPDNVSAPDVALRLSAPVVCVRPFDAVNKPSDVTVPPPVVEILLDVVIKPLAVSDETPVSAPPVETFNPVEDNTKVDVALPNTMDVAVLLPTFKAAPESIVRSLVAPVVPHTEVAPAVSVKAFVEVKLEAVVEEVESRLMVPVPDVVKFPPAVDVTNEISVALAVLIVFPVLYAC